MSQNGQTLDLVAGQTSNVEAPGNSPWEWVVLYNLSPYVCAVQAGATQETLAPWTADLFPAPPGHQHIVVQPSSTGGTIAGGVALILTSVWYGPGEKPSRVFPLSLAANAAASSVSGNVSITGNVAVVPGTPTPTFQVDFPATPSVNVANTVTVTVANTPAVTISGTAAVTQTRAVPLAGQIKVAVTGTAVALGAGAISRYVIVEALAANTAKVYLGPASVTSTSGLELAAGVISGPVPVDDLGHLFINGTAGDGVSFIAV